MPSVPRPFLVALAVLAHACSTPPVPLTEPWVSMGLALDPGTTVVESTPSRLGLRFLHDDPDEHYRGHPFFRDVEKRLSRLGYAKESSVDSGNDGTTTWAHEHGEGGAVSVSFSRDRKGRRATVDIAGSLPSRPPVEVSWAGSASVHDVLGTETGGGPTTMPVRRRSEKDAGVRKEGSAFAAYEVFTRCGRDWCVDGLRTTDAALPQGVVAASLTSDESEVLGAGAGSWLERGILVTNVSEKFVSFYEARAHLSAGAARADGSLACRTLARDGSVATLSVGGKTVAGHARMPSTLVGPFGEREARALVDAVRHFLEDQRDEGDSRAANLDDPTDTGFLLDRSGSAIFCLETSVGSNAGRVERVRASLR